MRSPLILTTLSLLFTLAGPRVFGAGFSLFSNTWGDVIVATDTTTEGRALTAPTPAQPVYYRGLSLGCKLGAIPGDLQPDVEKLNQLVARVLAKQGYLGTRPDGPAPTLFLIVQWGYLRPGSGDLMWFLGYDASKDIGAPIYAGQLGPEVFRRNFRSRTTETVLDSVRGPIYGIIVTAFEFQSANTAHPVIYWQTRIGLPANGKSMAEALPTMLVAARGQIGRESDTPILCDADEARSTRVELGELRLIEYQDSAPTPHSSGPKK